MGGVEVVVGEVGDRLFAGEALQEGASRFVFALASEKDVPKFAKVVARPGPGEFFGPGLCEGDNGFLECGHRQLCLFAGPQKDQVVGEGFSAPVGGGLQGVIFGEG